MASIRPLEPASKSKRSVSASSPAPDSELSAARWPGDRGGVADGLRRAGDALERLLDQALEFTLLGRISGLQGPADEAQPNVRRDGLEFFFFSTRPGTLGMADIYAATRAKTSGAWSAPVNLGSKVNSPSAETRPSLSWDGTTLYFGSTRPGGEGMIDIYVTTRAKLTGADR